MLDPKNHVRQNKLNFVEHILKKFRVKWIRLKIMTFSWRIHNVVRQVVLMKWSFTC